MLRFLVTLVFFLINISAFAQFELLKDINTSPNLSTNSNVQNLTDLNGTLYFTSAKNVGTELYKSDGSIEGTKLVRDINPGYASSNPLKLTPHNGLLYFTAINSETGRELWKTDGTSEGTSLVFETIGGEFNHQIASINSIGEDLFFVVRDFSSLQQYQLLKVSGSSDNVTLVREFDGYPNSIIGHDGFVFILADNSLWKSDGTADGTEKIYQYASPISPQVAFSTGDKIMINVVLDRFDAQRGYEVWVSNGTAEGTNAVNQIPSSWVIDDYAVANGLLLISIPSDINNTELWRSDGTAAGTYKVIDRFLPSHSKLELTVVGGRIYFSGAQQNTVFTSGDEVWYSDGTIEGTGVLIDISDNTKPQELTAHNEYLYFVGESDQGILEVYRSDGTASGTASIMDNDGSYWVPKDLMGSGDNIYFLADPIFNNQELRVVDGSSSGKQLTSISFNHSSRPRDFTVVGDRVFFRAQSNGQGSLSSQLDYSLWMTDGTTQGTISLNEIADHQLNDVTRINEHNGELYFINDRTELWKTDGTATGTILLKVFEEANSVLLRNSSLQADLFFLVSSFYHSDQVWKTDGSVVGTQLVLDIADASVESNFFSTDSHFYFSARNSLFGEELWVSDGTAEGTGLLKDIRLGQNSSEPEQLVSIGNLLFFMASRGAYGDEFWRTDGSEEGTYIVKDISEASSYVTIEGLTAIDNQLFLGVNVAGSAGLWKSDGTEEGTVFVEQIGSYSVEPFLLTQIGNDIYFGAYESFNNRAIWITDGTKFGTQKLIEITGSVNMFNYQNQLFYVASDGTKGKGIWRLDKNESKGELLGHFNQYFNDTHIVGTSPSENLFPFEEVILIPGTDLTYGTELWKFSYENEFSAIVNDQLEVDENSQVGTVVAILELSESLTALGFQIDQEDKFQNAFVVDNAGTVTVQDNDLLDHEKYPEIELTILINVEGDIIEETITIKINDVNELPSINEDQEFSLPVTSQDGFQLGTVKANDPEQDDLSFEIVSTDLDGAFSVTNDGILILANSTSIVESSKSEFQLIVSVSDGALQSEGTITIKLIESVIEDDEFEIVENSPNGSVVASLMNLDENAEWTLSIKSGNDDSAFEIGENGELIVEDSSKIDFELNQKFELVVQASYESEIDEATYIITVTDVNEAPVMTKTTLSFNENPAAQGKIGAIPATDPEDDDLTYTITSGNGGGNYVIVDDTLRANTPAYFDFETFATDTLIVSAADAEFSDSDTIFVKLLNVNEPLVFADTILSIDENSSTNKLVGQLVADDPEGINATFKILTFTPDSAFSINGASNLIVSDSALLDFEINPVFTLTVEATDGTFKDTATVTININDVFEIVNDKPNFVDQSFNVAENSPVGTAIGTLITTDTIEGPLTYRVLTGNELSIVSLVDTSGVLSVNDSSAFDFETNTSFEFEIETSDGLLTDTATVTVFLLDVSEPPSVDEGVFPIEENSPAGTLVGKLNGVDGDGDALTFALGEGNDGAFTINNAGTITVVNSTKLNFEVQEVFDITVLVSDGTDTINTTATINILDANDPPRFTNKLFEIEENPVVGDSVGNLNAFDEDGDEITFVIRDGNVSNAFAITTDGEIVVANEEAIDFEQRTTITLIVSALDGNVDFEDIVEIKIIDLIDNIQITGIDEVPIAKFYPNPTVDYMTVEALEPIDQLTIADMAGRVIMRLDQPVRDKVVIETHTFQPGIYILIIDHQAFKFMKR